MPSGLAGRQFRAVVIQPTSLANPGEPGCVAWACGLIFFYNEIFWLITRELDGIDDSQAF
jgi:hypothetical protein